MPKLKVYRTPIGFHDAYVAATSQKAALEAWGSDANLFARGVAEQVDDPELTAGPLASPGNVIKKLRGTLDEQLAALPSESAAPKKATALRPSVRKRATRPSRAKLDEAEAALSAVQRRQVEEEQTLARKEAELLAERRKTTERHQRELDRMSERVKVARAKYEAAMSAWRA
jgi:hypothetical protein